jgi:hypothetical protein
MPLQPWTDLTDSPLPQKLSGTSAVVSADGYVFVMGGSIGQSEDVEGLVSTVYSAKINNDGTLSKWRELTATPLPGNRNYASAVVSADGYIYFIGGFSEGYTSSNNVFSAKIIPGTGTIEAWQELTTSNLLLGSASAILSTDGYIYLMGGLDFDGNINNYIYVATVYSSRIIPGGMLTTWTELTATPLPQKLNNASAIVSTDGYIYIMGGLNDEDNALATVYSAKIIPETGTLSAWTDLTATPLPQTLSSTSAIVSADGYIYIMGGATGQGQPKSFESVYSAKIIPETGTLSAWTDLTATPLPQTLSSTSAIVSTDGYIYIMGGGNITNLVSIPVSTVYSAKIITPLPTPTPTPAPTPPVIHSNICFPAGTLIRTDQGEVAIEQLKRGKHTLDRRAIKYITQTISTDKYLVRVGKDAFGKNKPTKPTVVSKDHKIEFEGELVPVHRFLDYLEDMKKVTYHVEILYNVLLE